MFKMIFEKEILNQIRLQKFLVSVITTLILTVLCLSISAERYLYKRGEYNRAVQHQLDILKRTRDMTVTELGTGTFETADRFIFRKPNTLFIFCIGKDDHLGDIVRLQDNRVPLYAEPYSILNKVTEFDLRNILSDIVSKLDFGDIVTFLFSLIAVFIGFDIISAEREQGTLKLICANSISRLTIVLAKWSAGLAIITATVIISLIIAMIYSISFKDIAFHPDQGIRIILLFFISMLYILVFFQLSFLASGLVSASKTAIIALVTFWAVVTFIIPNTGMMLGRYLSPTPPIDYLYTEEDAINKKYASALDSDNRENVRIAREKSKNEIWRIQRYYFDSLYKQYNSATVWSLISPAAVFNNAAEIITGTSTADYMRFMDRVRITNEAYAGLNRNWKPQDRTFEYRKQFNVSLNELITNASYDDNRLTLRESAEKASSYAILLIVINTLLFGLILSMKIRVHIV